MATTFPAGFVWGAATTAYATEGAVREGGRGETIWDRWTRKPETIADGSTGDDASDSFRRYADDLALLRELGCTAYRFSVSWARVYPLAYGKINRAGLDHYERVVDALMTAGIAPWVTLYGWDLPQAMEERGGWLNRDTVAAFAEFADTMSRILGDRVRRWVTVAEPRTAAHRGYGTGTHAPGIANLRSELQAAHHLLLAHGEAVPVLRHNGGAGTLVGIALDLARCEPATDRDADITASHREDGARNRWYLDPLYRGMYPDDLRDVYGPDAPDARQTDMQTIAAPLDFLDIRDVGRIVVREDAAAPPLMTEPRPDPIGTGFDALLVRVHREYAPLAITVTVRGVPDTAEPDAARIIDDRDRADDLRARVPQIGDAIGAGVPVTGCFIAPLLDGFEWERGYTVRRGIVYTDFHTQERTLKESARWYTRVIAENEVRDA